jgi:hypothetical protein
VGGRKYEPIFLETGVSSCRLCRVWKVFGLTHVPVVRGQPPVADVELHQQRLDLDAAAGLAARVDVFRGGCGRLGAFGSVWGAGSLSMMVGSVKDPQAGGATAEMQRRLRTFVRDHGGDADGPVPLRDRSAL